MDNIKKNIMGCILDYYIIYVLLLKVTTKENG